MKKIIYCLIPLLLLVITTENIQAQNENTPVSEQDSMKRVKRSKKEREKPERTLLVKKSSFPIDKKKKTVGKWSDFAVAFDETRGKGSSEANPILIEKAEHLAYLAKQVNEGKNYVNKHFQLVSNIDLNTREWTPIGLFGEDYSDHSKRFCGYFHGNGHMVENLTILKGGDYQGLFGACGSGAYIEKLGIVNCYIRGKMMIGGLAGEVIEGSVFDCYTTGDVAGLNECVGGLVGINNGAVTNSYSTATVYSNSNDVGGLAGVNGDRMMGIASNCYATGKVNGYCNVGGLIGRNNNIISNCNASGNVSGEEWIGGLVGWTDSGMITNSHARGNVTGYFDIGGLVGFNGYLKSTVQINNCYATGTVIGNGSGNYCIGGLVGYSGGIVTNCYASGKVDGEESVGGLIGEHGGKTSNCHARGNVIGSFDVGGLIGFNGYPGSLTIVENSYATGSVTGYEVFNFGIGGFAGYSGGTIVNCFAIGPVSGEESVGGLIGEHGGTVVNSYASGAVAAKITAGGLVGWNWAKLQTCYATGKVKCKGEAGGLIGRNNDADAVISACYYDQQNTGMKTGIGVDNNNQINSVISKTTEEFTGKLPDGFDAEIWQIVSDSYPKLKTVELSK